MAHTNKRRAASWMTAAAFGFLAAACSTGPLVELDERSGQTGGTAGPGNFSRAGTPGAGGYQGQAGDKPGSGPRTGEGCTLTQGYWKNHGARWPVASLTLGSVSYSAQELMAIFNRPPSGNGLVALAHQLIAAKLNQAAGASAVGMSSTVADADALIGSLVVPPKGRGVLSQDATGALNDALAAFNEGLVGPGHCDDGPPVPPTGTSYPPTSDTGPMPVQTPPMNNPPIVE